MIKTYFVHTSHNGLIYHPGSEHKRIARSSWPSRGGQQGQSYPILRVGGGIVVTEKAHVPIDDTASEKGSGACPFSAPSVTFRDHRVEAVLQVTRSYVM